MASGIGRSDRHPEGIKRSEVSPLIQVRLAFVADEFPVHEHASRLHLAGSTSLKSP